MLSGSVRRASDVLWGAPRSESEDSALDELLKWNYNFRMETQPPPHNLLKILLTQLLILNNTMMRAATALIALMSILSAPVASAACGDCCNRLGEHQLPPCHDKAHAHLGPHTHHMNRLHMVTQDSDASVAIRPCDHRWRDSRSSCQRAACLSTKPFRGSVASIPAQQLQMFLHLLATTNDSSLPNARAHPAVGVRRIEISSSPSASVTLRV